MLAALFLSINVSAHFVWIETAEAGEIGESQEIKIFWGEYDDGKEAADGKSFTKIKDFELYVIQPNGKKTVLTAKPNGDHFLSTYTPDKNGTFTIILNHNKIPVYDLSKYGHGIFKANYHATAKIQVGDKTGETVVENPNSISVQNLSESSDVLKIQAMYRGEPMAKTEIVVMVAGGWTKKLKTDENGYAIVKLPYQTTYVMEVTYKEEVAGSFEGVDYNYIWHCCSLSVGR